MTSVMVLARMGEGVSTNCPSMSNLTSKMDNRKHLIPLRENHPCPPCLPYNQKRDSYSSILWVCEKVVLWAVVVDIWTNGIFLNVLKNLHLSTFLDGGHSRHSLLPKLAHWAETMRTEPTRSPSTRQSSTLWKRSPRGSLYLQSLSQDLHREERA
jgi:hypothetical protein